MTNQTCSLISGISEGPGQQSKGPSDALQLGPTVITTGPARSPEDYGTVTSALGPQHLAKGPSCAILGSAHHNSALFTRPHEVETLMA